MNRIGTICFHQQCYSQQGAVARCLLCGMNERFSKHQTLIYDSVYERVRANIRFVLHKQWTYHFRKSGSYMYVLWYSIYSCMFYEINRLKVWSRNCLAFQITWFHPRYLVGFVLLDHSFSVECFVIDACPFVLLPLAIVLSVLLWLSEL